MLHEVQKNYIEKYKYQPMTLHPKQLLLCLQKKGWGRRHTCNYKLRYKRTCMWGFEVGCSFNIIFNLSKSQAPDFKNILIQIFL